MNVCNYKKKRDKPADTIRVFGMSVDSKYQINNQLNFDQETVKIMSYRK